MGFSAALAAADNLLLETFGETGGITLWPDTSRRKMITAVHDAPWQGVDVPDGGQIQGRDACFTAHDNDLTELKKGDAVYVRGETLYVKNLQPDGTGLTVVYLSPYRKLLHDRTGGLL